jgi:hypothetical protein
MAGMKCTICAHPERAIVDRLLAAGSLSDRRIARQFGLTRASLARHRKNHLMRAVQRQIQRREREDQSAAEVWGGRLEEAFTAAREGLARAAADEERWTNAIGFLGQMNKSIELGLKSAGVIEGARGPASVNIEQVILLPGGTTRMDGLESSEVPATMTTAMDEDAIDVKALPSPPEEA